MPGTFTSRSCCPTSSSPCTRDGDRSRLRRRDHDVHWTPPIGTYDQCSNDTGAGYPSTARTPAASWINGNLNAQQLHVPGGRRDRPAPVAARASLPAAPTRSRFEYGTTKGGKHAYDYLTTWQLLRELDHRLADRLRRHHRLHDGAGRPARARSRTTRRRRPLRRRRGHAVLHDAAAATITARPCPALRAAPTRATARRAITVTFTVASSGSMCSTKGGATTCGIAIWFGAHVARHGQWGLQRHRPAPASAGSPYHVALAKHRRRVHRPARQPDAGQHGRPDRAASILAKSPDGRPRRLHRPVHHPLRLRHRLHRRRDGRRRRSPDGLGDPDRRPAAPSASRRCPTAPTGLHVRHPDLQPVRDGDDRRHERRHGHRHDEQHAHR